MKHAECAAWRTSPARRSSVRAIANYVLIALAIILSLALPVSPAFAAASPDTFGVVEAYSTHTPGDTLMDGYGYTDDWFAEDPSQANDDLALASMQLVTTAVTDNDAAGTDYLHGLGFENVGFSHFNTSDPDDCAYMWGTKAATDDDGPYTLVAIAVQSYALDNATKTEGWAQNFAVNGEGSDAGVTSGEHYALAKAAGAVISEVAQQGGTGRVKYWICGQSRGGAIANIMAAHLPQALVAAGATNAGIYAYTFEAPATVDADVSPSPESYDYIHNYICSDDIVPRVPVWGMTRYGTSHELKTEETEGQLAENLQRLGSSQADVDRSDAEDQVIDLVSMLEERIPTRADYSLAREDTFEGEDGTTSIAYSYQTALKHLMGMVFGGELEGLSLDSISDDLEELAPLAYALSDAVKAEDAGDEGTAIPRYWEAAQTLRATLAKLAGGGISLTDEDAYAVLRIIGPTAVNPDFERTNEPIVDIMSALEPIVDLASNAGNMTYSHHFDSLLARLRTLSPLTKLDDIDMTIDEPKAGDSTSKAPAEVVAFIEDLPSSDWLSAEATWLTDDETLAADSVQYLEVTLTAKAHEIDEDWKVTLNGEGPSGDPVICYDDGTGTTTVTWTFVIGSPATATVTFDAAGHGTAPEPMTVNEGTILRYATKPEFPDRMEEDGTTWRFTGWVDDEGKAWDDIRVGSDITLHAKWIQVVDNIEITISGFEKGKMPTVSVPDGAPYVATIESLTDENWDDVDALGEDGAYSMSITIAITDPDKAEFLLEGEEGSQNYVGKFTYNGKAYPDSMYYDDGLVYFSYEFEFVDGEGAKETETPDPIHDEPTPSTDDAVVPKDAPAKDGATPSSADTSQGKSDKADKGTKTKSTKSTQTKATKGSQSKASKKALAKTGDETNLLMPCALAVSGIVLIVMGHASKRRTTSLGRHFR